jgi:PAS domain S-box-containing protein
MRAYGSNDGSTSSDGEGFAADTLAGILDISTEAIIVTDERLRIEVFSRGAADIFGYDPGEIIGSTIDRLIPERLRRSHAGHVNAFRTGAENGRRMDTRGELVALRKTGEEFPIEASIAKRDAGGRTRFTVILRDISQRKSMEHQLLDAREKADAANTAKTLFMANMNHDLRTPLNAIIGFSQLLQRGTSGEHTSEYARYIERSGLHLLSMVNNILDVCLLDLGKVQVADETIDVATLVDDLLGIMSEIATRGRIALRATVAPGTPPLRADPRLCRQIFINLMTNAVKFTPAGGTVELTAGLAADGGIEIVVRDTGIGIAARDVARAMQPFVQLETGKARRFDGVGLGLSIVKSFVDEHGGRFDIVGTPGGGTAATVWFPPERIVQPPAAGPPATP